MPLPIVNVVPKYELVVPSTKQVITFRPYLVKEEKLLLMAFESKSVRTIVNAMLDIVKECVYEELDVQALPTFDVEYIFLKIRAKSVGETATIGINCPECGTRNEVVINIDEIQVHFPEGLNNIIQLTEQISIEMRYPTYRDALEASEGLLSQTEVTEQTADDIISMVTSGIAAILTEDSRIDTADYSKEEMLNYVNQLTSAQFTKLAKFYENLPKLNHQVSFTCTNCGAETNITIEDLADFF